MIAKIEHPEKGSLKIDFQLFYDLARPLSASAQNPRAWHCGWPEMEPVRAGSFVGSVKMGSSVNFFNVSFNPHGHGTHTECLGHISAEQHSLRTCLSNFNGWARLHSFLPNPKNGQWQITADQLAPKLENWPSNTALIIRTLPNEEEKISRNYSGSDPVFIEEEAMLLIRQANIPHLLIDTPSVDPEEDGGALLAHKAFWNYPEAPRFGASITELIYVPNAALDGDYWLQLGVPAFELDAAPSRPLIYPVLSEDQ
ncbi:cyclase family protein [Saprospira sp. CCB-QB6]|uniref:cyclase family protein n=1 Tax=Saprospira sp. CCB-QB6 TaxID=3023936 RepID=UPI00234935B6|nr:cyclase family protein [Saprospira sp. CCB-QB6]WCL80932.1 cyclase family protein [Saprospira sp. CCB-QB6]